MHRHKNVGRKLSRNAGPRKALFRSLATSVILYEKIKTTLPKAKEIRPIVEKLITKAKNADLNDIRALNAFLLDPKAVEKLVKEIAPLYKDRKGGYTRIVRAGNRMGDNAEMAIIELLDVEKLTDIKSVKVEKQTETKEEKKQTKTTKKDSTKTKIEKKSQTKPSTKAKKKESK